MNLWHGNIQHILVWHQSITSAFPAMSCRSMFTHLLISVAQVLSFEHFLVLSPLWSPSHCSVAVWPALACGQSPSLLHTGEFAGWVWKHLSEQKTDSFYISMFLFINVLQMPSPPSHAMCYVYIYFHGVLYPKTELHGKNLWWRVGTTHNHITSKWIWRWYQN